MVTTPSVTGTKPKMPLAKVDLPQPDSPTTPKVSPGFKVKLTPSTALRIRGLPNIVALPKLK